MPPRRAQRHKHESLISPRDATPIIINGTTIDRANILSNRVASPRDALPNVQLLTVSPRNQPPIIDLQTDAQLVANNVIISPRQSETVSQDVRELIINTRPISPAIMPFIMGKNIEAPATPRPHDTPVIDNKYAFYDTLPVNKQREIRDEFRIKFNILARSNTGIEMRPVTAEENLSLIVKRYEDMVKHIKVCQTANQYRLYTVIYFLGLEAICVKMLGLNASGFTVFQVKMLNEYDSLMIELGEKHHDRKFDSWPVEARVFLMGIFYLAIFIIASIIGSWMGGAASVPVIIDLLSKGLKGTMSNTTPTADGGFDLLSMVANFGSAFVGNQNKPQPDITGENIHPAYSE